MIRIGRSPKTPIAAAQPRDRRVSAPATLALVMSED
jgi:hypothetical protein